MTNIAHDSLMWQRRKRIIKAPEKAEAESHKDPQIAGSSNKRKALAINERDSDDEGAEYLRRRHKFIKSTIKTDYQPDICKDYKETGFCGFGDSCKFLHDRSDYKHGWQLEQEWKKGEYQEEDDEKYLIKDSDDDEDDDGSCKNRCEICQDTFKSPVITKCKHIFCADCAEKECNVKCFICDKPTSGIFKNASKLVKCNSND